MKIKLHVFIAHGVHHIKVIYYQVDGGNALTPSSLFACLLNNAKFYDIWGIGGLGTRAELIRPDLQNILGKS